MKLKDEGFTAWLDTDRLSAGQDWRQEIDESIRGALAVIAIMSPESKQSEYVT
ncbi:MAG: eukaryotic-like serine/threonine-protein kinase [Hyphomicrobiales bacterium]|nr:eukaryotic-like serine/threonine-protein kinase [Hyphomicrobiales bacterium]